MSGNTGVVPSTRQGMGTILYAGGAAFRVWAPFASSVCVAGTFNAWSPTINPFASEGNGYWSFTNLKSKILLQRLPCWLTPKIRDPMFIPAAHWTAKPTTIITIFYLCHGITPTFLKNPTGERKTT